MDTMLVDCTSCAARGPDCGACVVSVLLGAPAEELTDDERTALGVLSAGGLLPPLRLVPGVGREPDAGAPLRWSAAQ